MCFANWINVLILVVILPMLWLLYSPSFFRCLWSYSVTWNLFMVQWKKQTNNNQLKKSDEYSLIWNISLAWKALWEQSTPMDWIKCLLQISKNITKTNTRRRVQAFKYCEITTKTRMLAWPAKHIKTIVLFFFVFFLAVHKFESQLYILNSKLINLYRI